MIWTRSKHNEPNRQLAYALFRELEFTSLTREFADSAPLFDGLRRSVDVEAERRYEIIKTRADLDKLIRKLWETEHWSFEVDDSNSPAKADSYAKKPPLGVAIATGAGACYYIDLENFEDGTRRGNRAARDILSNGFLEKCYARFQMQSRGFEKTRHRARSRRRRHDASPRI